MNFIVQSSELLKQLQKISGVLNTSNTLPILDNYLFEITKNTLVISASDVETTMKTSMKIEANEDGNIAIPAKFLLDIIKTFSDQPITFKINTENYGIDMISENGKYHLVGQNAEDFPKVLEIENSNTIELPSDILSKGIGKTIFATGNDSLRVMMNGVFCQFLENELTFVSTDSHKLVRYKRTDFNSSVNSSFILPKKPLNLLKTNLNDDTKVKIEFNESNAVFKMEDLELSCRLIEGVYPNYEAVIPNETPNVLILNRYDLLNSLKRVSNFANKSTHLVCFKIKGLELTISAEDLDFSNNASERFTCNYTGDDIEIGFNSRFLMEILNNIETEEVRIEMREPNQAGIILPSEKRIEGEDVLMLIMPLILNR